jgi:hypothetical protein
MIATLALLSPLLAPAPLIAPQERVDYGRILRQRAEQVEKSSIEEIWREVARRGALVGEGEPEELDAAIDRVLESSDTIGARGVLLLAGLRIQGAEVNWPLVAERVGPLIENDDDQVSLGAVMLLGEDELRNRLEEEPISVLSNSIQNVAEDGDRPPRLRVVAAVSSHRSG